MYARCTWSGRRIVVSAVFGLVIADAPWWRVAAQTTPTSGSARTGATSASDTTRSATDPAFKVDLSIPDAPAMSVTGTAVNALLRPSNTRDLAAALSNFGGGEGAFRLPRAFAVEGSPVLLLQGARLTLADYQRRAPFTRLRVSFATNRLDRAGAPTAVGVGARTALIDDGDPRTNTDYRASVDSVLVRASALELLDAQLRTCVVTHPITDERKAFLARVEDSVKARAGRITPPPPTARDSAAIREAVRRDLGDVVEDPCAAAQRQVAAALGIPLDTVGARGAAGGNPPSAAHTIADSTTVQDRLRAVVAERRAAINGELAERRRVFEATHWNARVLDVAAAFGALARDSLGHNARSNDAGAWLTYGMPAGASSQLLGGIQWRHARDSLTGAWQDGGSAGVRLYGGTNEYKAFVEGAAGFGGRHTSYAGGGTELRVLNSLWATAVAGYEMPGRGQPGRVVTRLFVRAAPPAH